MSIGFHLRTVGQPGRIAALHKFLGTLPIAAMQCLDCATIDIANHWRAQFPES
jgi:hypothetical protein